MGFTRLPPRAHPKAQSESSKEPLPKAGSTLSKPIKIQFPVTRRGAELGGSWGAQLLHSLDGTKYCTTQLHVTPVLKMFFLCDPSDPSQAACQGLGRETKTPSRAVPPLLNGIQATRARAGARDTRGCGCGFAVNGPSRPSVQSVPLAELTWGQRGESDLRLRLDFKRVS